MKFNLTFLEFLVFLLFYILLFLWFQFGRRLRRWWHDYFRQRHKPRSLKPKAPDDCPACNQLLSLLPSRPKPEVVPWSERKSPRGRRKTIDSNGFACLNPVCAYFAIADAQIHALVSNGRRGNQKIRYWKCQACGGCRTSRYGTPLYYLKTPLAHVTMVMTALSEGVDISACVRIFENHHPTISRWLMRCGQHSQRLHQQLFHQAVQVGHLQLDELVTKVKLEAERIWLWTAVAAKSKLFLAFHLGRRSTADAQHLLHQVWQRLIPDCLPIFTSDGLNQYFYAITAHFGTWHKPLRARKYHWLPDVRLLYAQLRKRRQGRQVSFLYSIIRLGSRYLIRTGLQALAFTGKVQTAFVERANLTLRELIAPLSRRTWSMAYDKYHLTLHIHWGLAYYHFCRPHQSLTIPIRGPSKRRYRTPAMAANLVNRRWSVRDLLQLPVPEGVWLDPFPAMKGCR
ncbi:MAG: IS1 family transposase [Ardenticatenaceae bacterium]|nr:IS1 family transposase [Ardenticatenaceae bacterium]